nr:hypothetical protein Ade03nite_65410 [Actinoplanes derwentensis]
MLVIALTVAGTPPAATAPAPPGHHAELVVEMLRRRTVAFTSGDEAGWLTDVDPRHPETISYERSRFRQLRQTGPSFFRLFPAGEHTDRAHADRAHADREVYVRQVVGWPGRAKTALNTHTWCLTFRDGRVMITAVRAYLGPGV